MNDFKARLGGAQWRKYKDTMVEVGGEELPVVIRRAPPGVAVLVIEEARKAGDMAEDGRPVGETGALRLLARMVCTVLFQQGGVRPLFERDDAEDLATVMVAPWLMDLKDDCMAALGATGATLEHVKGNSEATPTGQ